MKADMHIGIIDLLVFLGIFQGLLLAWFFLKNSTNRKKANLYQGLFILGLSLAIFEELLNNTGYIVKVLHLSNFSEPINLTIGPLIYLYAKRSLHPEKKGSKDWIHFILFFLYLVYMGFYFIQPELAKYNSFIHSKHPNWQKLEVIQTIPEDPLSIRMYINEITAVVFLVYLSLTYYMLWNKKEGKPDNQRVKNNKTQDLKTSTIHVTLLLVVFIVTKLTFERDVGDYFIALYVTLLFFLTIYKIMSKSEYFMGTHSLLDLPVGKYTKSSLSEKRKREILKRIEHEMSEKEFYASSLASLANLAKQVHESTHHVSQVINEKMGKNFFELLAHYRVEAAKKLLSGKQKDTFTIEEVAEKVGYNSKSAFNTTFKKLTGKTPSEYRKKTY